jgi:hypothetical protein
MKWNAVPLARRPYDRAVHGRPPSPAAAPSVADAWRRKQLKSKEKSSVTRQRLFSGKSPIGFALRHPVE